MIDYDDEVLMRFLKSRCVTYGIGGKLNVDLGQLEQHLRRELTRPEITVEISAFQWLGEVSAGGMELRSAIRQRDLPPEVEERLIKELHSPSLANVCLQKLQMSVSFILKSGGALSKEHAGEMLLMDYLKQVLRETDESLPSPTARSEVHLWHIDSFLALLKKIINRDPMEMVSPKYCEELPSALKQELVEAAERLPTDLLVRMLAMFAETSLHEEYIGAEIEMLETMQHMEELSHDIEEFARLKENLPAGIKMRHWVSVYRVLKKEDAPKKP